MWKWSGGNPRYGTWLSKPARAPALAQWRLVFGSYEPLSQPSFTIASHTSLPVGSKIIVLLFSNDGLRDISATYTKRFVCAILASRDEFRTDPNLWRVLEAGFARPHLHR
jgi:hypothetical protein